MSVGSTLKAARNEKGYNLDYMQEHTKIQTRFLQAIEDDNFSVLPGSFYTRVFIRQYAETVGLNPDELFATFQNEIPASVIDEESTRSTTVQNITPQVTESKWLKLLPKIILVVSAIVGAALIYFLFDRFYKDNNENVKENTQVIIEQSKEGNGGKTNETKPEVKEEPKEQPKEELPPPVTPKQTLTFVSSGKNNTSIYELKSATTFNVKVLSTNNVWVSIKKPSAEIFQGTLAQDASQVFDLTGEASVSIRTGKAQHTKIFINDEELIYQVDPTKTTTQTIEIKFVQ